MSHFAYVPNIINGKGIVEKIICIDEMTLATGAWGNPKNWIQTSYNTFENKHLLGNTPLRGNFAGVGDIYDQINDKFYSPKPFSSWVLNQETWSWESSKPIPVDGKQYTWDESTLSWKEIINNIS